MKSLAKTCAIAFLLILISGNAYSQLLPISLEIRAGSNLSTMDIKGYDTNPRAGLNAGLIGEFSIPLTRFFVQSGILFTAKGASVESNYMSDKNKTTVQANYLQIPVLAGYKFRLVPTVNMRIFAGPYFAQGVGGRTTTLNGSRNGTFRASGLQRFDSGITVGTGVQLYKLTLNLGYEYGWTNVSHTDISVHNQNAFLTLGYKIF